MVKQGCISKKIHIVVNDVLKIFIKIIFTKVMTI